METESLQSQMGRYLLIHRSRLVIRACSHHTMGYDELSGDGARKVQ